MNDENAAVAKIREMNDRRKEKKAKDIAQQAQGAKAAFDILEKIPQTSGIGTALKKADKLTGGKVSNAAAKMNKFSPKSAQMGMKALGKASNSLSRLTSALNKKNSLQQNQLQQHKTKGNVSAGSSKLNSGLFDFNKKKKTEEQSPDSGGYSNFNLSYKTIEKILIFSVPVFVVIIFCCVIVSSTQVYINSIGLGMADELKGADVDEAINKTSDEDLNEEITDEKVNEDRDIETEDDDTAYASDIYISDTPFKNSKLNNFVQVNNVTYFERKYNEAKLEKLEDFYPPITSVSENYSKNDVYDFYNKMYDIYVLYRDTYKVYLDLPLLMSTLKYQSSNMNTIFSANLSDEDKTDYNVSDREEFDYYYDWTQTDYKLDKKNSEHDMEILAQNMVSVQVKEQCVNSSGKVVEENILRDSEIDTKTLSCEEGETYKTENLGYVVDNEKYKDFLKEFIEKKYYYSGKYKVERKNEKMLSNISGTSTCTAQREFIKYELTQDQLERIASLCQQEQGSAEGAAAEASLMANLFEIKGSSYGTGANGLYNYVRTSGWFASAAKHMDAKSANDEIIAAVKSVLVDGKRTLPGYIDEHDCISCSRGGAGDITSVTNNDVAISKNDKSSYKQHISQIKTVYDATYTFYSFPAENSDPFGYTSEERRKEIGDFHYDFKTGEPVGCGSSVAASGMADAMIKLAISEYENNGGANDGAKYQDALGYGRGVPWCVIFVSYLIKNTEYNGQTLYDIIGHTSASTGDMMGHFHKNDRNLKFYYNDTCDLYKGKNGNITYTPKPGDIAFFDHALGSGGIADISRYARGSYPEGPQDHTGIVEKYENGVIYTIEGNISDKIVRRVPDKGNCQIIGFGSWY